MLNIVMWSVDFNWCFCVCPISFCSFFQFSKWFHETLKSTITPKVLEMRPPFELLMILIPHNNQSSQPSSGKFILSIELSPHRPNLHNPKNDVSSCHQNKYLVSSFLNKSINNGRWLIGGTWFIQENKLNRNLSQLKSPYHKKDIRDNITT